MTPESAVLKACLQWLLIRRVYAWRQNTGGMTASYKGKKRFVSFGIKGMSDILGILPDGRFLAVECKSLKGKTTDSQDQFLKKINDSGGLGVVSRGVNDMERLVLPEIQKAFSSNRASG